ncbi:hypothetical protein [Nocardia sp. NPDC046763]|uniref:hypothetical protein n=1 Tax=Nocardia sp. NPDC046763 TaxID=3155256 RepID=UPI0033C1FE24
MSGIPCRFKDGTPVSPAIAEMLARAFGFSSADHMEQAIAAGEKRRRARINRAAA